MRVLCAAEDDQVAGIVVERVAVDMVDYFVRGQAATDLLFHHPTVEGDPVPIDADVPVAALYPARALASSIVPSDEPSWLSCRVLPSFPLAATLTRDSSFVIHSVFLLGVRSAICLVLSSPIRSEENDGL